MTNKKKSNQTSIAVVDFENHTGNGSYDSLKRGLSESLMTKLANRPDPLQYRQ